MNDPMKADMLRPGLALCPADGWWGVYWSKEPPYYVTSKVACWVGYMRAENWGGKDGEVTYPVVAGYEGGEYLENMEDIDNFAFYIHEAEITEEHRTDWSAQGEEWAKNRAEDQARCSHGP